MFAFGNIQNLLGDQKQQDTKPIHGIGEICYGIATRISNQSTCDGIVL